MSETNIESTVGVFLEASSGMSDPVIVAKKVMFYTKYWLKKTSGIDISFQLGADQGSLKDSLVEYSEDPIRCREIAERTIGSATARYFTTPNPTNSKLESVLAHREYGGEAGADVDLADIIKSKNLPEELRNTCIEVNKGVFYNNDYPHLSAKPDGYCMFGNNRVPVELLTKQEMLHLKHAANSQSGRSTPSSGGFKEKVIKIRLGEEIRRRVAKAGRRRKQSEDDDSTYEAKKITTRSITKKPVGGRFTCLRKLTPAERKSDILVKMSSAQSARQFRDNYAFINDLPSAFMTSKKTQIMVQMAVMKAECCLCMYHDSFGVHYYFVKQMPYSLMQVQMIEKNVMRWFNGPGKALL